MDNNQELCIGLSVAWSNVCESKAYGHDKSIIQFFFHTEIPKVYEAFNSTGAGTKILFCERGDGGETEFEEISVDDVGKQKPKSKNGEIYYEIHTDLTSSNMTFAQFNKLMKDWEVDTCNFVN